MPNEVAETVADAARSCPVMRAARRLAEAIDTDGWPVTPSGTLRPTGVPRAAAALGLRVTPPVRRVADVPAVHRAWMMAIAMRMVDRTSGRAVAATPTTLEGDDEAVLTGWLHGLRSICADSSGRKHPEMVQWLVMLALEALEGDLKDSDPKDEPDSYRPEYKLYRQVNASLRDWQALRDRLDTHRIDTWLAPPYPHGGDWKLFELLVDVGVLRGTSAAPEVTALGRWAVQRLRAEAPIQVISEWPASTLLARLQSADHDDDLWQLAWPWMRERPSLEVAHELLTAAAGTDAITRSIAVRLVTFLGEATLPMWRGVLDTDDLGPHARKVLSWWGQGSPTESDDWWLAVEWAVAALTTAGPDEALSCLADVDEDADAPGLVAATSDSCHPQAEELAKALDAFLRSGEPRSMEHLIQVKVQLSGWRPTTWRRVLLPATDSLGKLHWVISVLFGWEGVSHLHVFEAGSNQYSDPSCPLDDALDEDDARLSRLYARGIRTITYTYDLGACWKHEITLERLVLRKQDEPPLQCVGFTGDSPIEYPGFEDEYGDETTDPVVTKPFRLEKVNATLKSGCYDVDDVFDDDPLEE